MSLSFLGQSPVNSGTATPFQRIIEPSQLGLYLNLEQAELLRIRRYHEHWRFYVGQHWKFQREDGEPLVTLNYTRALIDKSVAWLVGAGMTIKVPEVLRDYTLPILQEVWGYNLEPQLLYNMATLGAVTGDVFVLITYVEPTAQARRINPHTKGQIRIQLLNSEQVYPQWDPLNTDVLTSVRIETIFYDDRHQEMGNSNQDNTARQLHTRRFTQIITATHYIEQYQGQDPVTKDNPLGEIPLVHIKNHAIPGEYYGLGDMDSLIDLNRELNEKATDISDIINYHSAPVTVITGAKAKDLERSARSVWSGLPADAKVFTLEMQGNLEASIKYMDKIRLALLEISGIPEGSLGTQQPISNTSGVALHTQYQPLVEKTNRKKAFYEPGMQDINYFILRHMELVDPSFRLPTDLCKHCGGRIVEFAPERPGLRGKRKCYMIDKQTFDYMKPEEVKIRIVRQFSFGNKIDEVAYAQAKAEFGKVGASFWDPAPEQTAEEKAQEAHDEQLRSAVNAKPMEGGEENPETGETSEPTAPEVHDAGPPKPKPPQLPGEAIELPPEPEEIQVNRSMVDVVTGEENDAGSEIVTVVPTRCERHEYLNPYATEVCFNDTVPKDKQIQAELLEKYQRNRWVSKQWCRRQLDDVEDPEAMEVEIEEEIGEEKEHPGLLDDQEQKAAAGADKKGDELSRTVGPPFGSNLPGG